ncbi:site-specific integrase [Halopelagius longus]|uniref:Site-specific integrase n=1 Tax=Halopelagius longus TaxID=1236180 RepID=A0A370IQP8_9EURY|nr:site-specific integrase [Halopelagius longus]
MEAIDGIPLLPEPSQNLLNERQRVDYRHHREGLIRWMLKLGKNPDRAEGYARQTAKRRATNADMFYRWVWQEYNGYTTTVTHEYADEYTRELAYSDLSDTHKSNLQKTLKMLFRWRKWEFGDSEWQPEITFSGQGSASQPRDYFTQEERKRLRDAALEYGSVPHYCSLTPEQRQEWKRHLAQRFRKPMQDIGREEFERANGFKVPSLVWVSLDVGLRPIEVERAKVSWCDYDNAVLRIPANDSAKNHDNWSVSLQSRTAEILQRWTEERRLYDKYGETDRLWLTREGNPYQSTALKYVLGKLTDLAGIETEDRQLSWYAIRHSVGTYMAREEGLAAAQAQLRHHSVRTTMKYDQAPVEDRRDALSRMG